MRVTIDIDGGKFRYWMALLKGRLLIGRSPDMIYKTRKGYHLIWSGLPISEEQSIRYRKLIGDDPKRINLDLQGRRLRQVLFSTKEIRYYKPAESFDEDKILIKKEVFTRRQIK